MLLMTASSTNFAVEEDGASDRDESDSEPSIVTLTTYQAHLVEALRRASVYVVHSWESRGLVEIPTQSVAVCITTALPSNEDAQDLVEEMAARKLTVPIIVLLLRPANSMPERVILQKEMKALIRLGASDVVVEPSGAAPEAEVDVWLARAAVRSGEAVRQQRKADEIEEEMQNLFRMAAAREDALFWQQSHNMFEGLPAMNPHLQEPAENTTFGSRHQVHSLINSGAFSDVYEVEDGQRQVRAMKAVKKEKLTNWDLVKCVSNEVQILRRLHHVNVVRFYGTAQSREHIIVLMELVGRRNLFGVLKSADEKPHEAPFELSQARHFFHQMASAVSYCHGEDVTHRDIKPENFAISDEGDVVKLVDFGMAAELGAPLKHKGTMPFAGPEVIEENHSLYNAAAADIWSLGVVLVEMVCGLHSLSRILKWADTMLTSDLTDASDLRNLMLTPGKLRASLKERMRPGIPLCADLDGMIRGMLSTEPHARWTSGMILESCWFPPADKL